MDYENLGTNSNMVGEQLTLNSDNTQDNWLSVQGTTITGTSARGTYNMNVCNVSDTVGQNCFVRYFISDADNNTTLSIKQAGPLSTIESMSGVCSDKFSVALGHGDEMYCKGYWLSDSTSSNIGKADVSYW